MNTPTPTFQTVHSIVSPFDASKLSGRYETTAEVDGKSVPVLRSLRHAPNELVLKGSLTPKNKKKVKPSSADIDNLCGLLQTKAKVTPNKKKPSSRAARHAKKKAAGVDSVKENLGKALKMVPVKTTRFDDDVKKAAATPVRRSRRSRGRSIDSNGN